MCLERQESWWKIRANEDQYEGWLNPFMICEIPEETLKEIKAWQFVLEGSLLLHDGSRMRLPLGARVPFINHSSYRIVINGISWRRAPDLKVIFTQTPASRVDLIRHFLNTPYLWGGRSGYGIDCSGLTQLVYAMCGISIPRDSSQQAQEGIAVNPGEQKAGDLAFFSKPNQDRVSHVGMLISKNQIIHAAGKVRCDTFSEAGIWNQEIQRLTHQLVSIRRW